MGRTRHRWAALGLIGLALGAGPRSAAREPAGAPRVLGAEATAAKAKASKQRPKTKKQNGKKQKKYASGRGPSKERKSPRRSAAEIAAAGKKNGGKKSGAKKSGAKKSTRAAKTVKADDGSDVKIPPPPRRKRGKCPYDMIKVRNRFCIDRYEAYVALITKGGKLKRHSPFEPLDDAKNIKALNRRGRMPQAYISQREAARACKNAGKRLCTDSEWITACKGKRPTIWPYGKTWKPGRCNDQGKSHFNELFGKDGKAALQSAYTFENLNDDRLNRPAGTCAPAGRFKRCKNSFHVYDMVGNLHEWTSNPGGVFRGGYYLDVRQHGDGCDYKTTAHSPKYHDYSTGFRCCADL